MRREIGELIVAGLGNLKVSAGGFVQDVEFVVKSDAEFARVLSKKLGRGPQIFVSAMTRGWTGVTDGQGVGDATIDYMVSYFGRFYQEEGAMADAVAGKDLSVDDALDEIVAALQGGRMRWSGATLRPLVILEDRVSVLEMEKEQRIFGAMDVRVVVDGEKVASGLGLERVLPNR